MQYLLEKLQRFLSPAVFIPTKGQIADLIMELDKLDIEYDNLAEPGIHMYDAFFERKREAILVWVLENQGGISE